MARAIGMGRALAGVVLLFGLTARAELPYEEEPISYLKATATDPVARLDAKLADGSVTLAHDPKFGYLPAVLEHLGVPKATQTLVFSKTSFQAPRISPRAPRALYFNDDVYIGYVRGGDVLEVAAVDPQLGAVFYTLDQEQAAKPQFDRQTHACLSCHASPKTEGVPGHLVRSVFPDRGGMPVYSAGTFVTTHESPFSERFGGWYVTGTHGPARHMGNAFVSDKSDPENLDRDAGANVTDLADRFDTRKYLAPGSDLVALLLLEHQAKFHNLVTLVNYQTKLALHYERGINAALGRPEGAMSDSTARRFRRPVEDLLQYMLFIDEPRLGAPVAGSTDLAATFAAAGKTDPQGRSLRELDLNSRLLKYPCSYLVHSESVRALPAPAKDYLARRLGEVLLADDPGEPFRSLSKADRTAVAEILRATEPELTAKW
jgi:hypothetical protein